MENRDIRQVNGTRNIFRKSWEKYKSVSESSLRKRLYK